MIQLFHINSYNWRETAYVDCVKKELLFEVSSPSFFLLFPATRFFKRRGEERKSVKLVILEASEGIRKFSFSKGGIR
jgi:hypothetical protein